MMDCCKRLMYHPLTYKGAFKFLPDQILSVYSMDINKKNPLLNIQTKYMNRNEV